MSELAMKTRGNPRSSAHLNADYSIVRVVAYLLLVGQLLFVFPFWLLIYEQLIVPYEDVYRILRIHRHHTTRRIHLP